MAGLCLNGISATKRAVFVDQMKKSVEKFAEGKHKKVEQALGLSLRNLFEQLAWRTSPAAVRT